MKFIVSSSTLLKPIQTLFGVLNTTNTLPILDYFLFELGENKLRVTATDLETTMSAVVEVETDDDGSIAVPARLLLETIKTFPEQPLTFTMTDQNTVEISSSSGKYALAYATSEEFPKAASVSDASQITIPGNVLGSAINNTLFASGNDDLRPVMSGVFFQFSSTGLTFVATDAHKLVRYIRTDITSDESTEFIMPKKPLTLLKSILTGNEVEVQLEYNNSNAHFTFEDIELTCRLIDGKYPNYEAVIPKDNPNVLTIDRNLFLTTIKRVSIFSNKTTHQVRLKLAGAELNISAEDIDYSNRADERISCSFQGSDMEIGFNARFLIEMLNNITCKEVQFEMSLPNRAGLLTPIDGTDENEHITMLVMPVMLNN